MLEESDLGLSMVRRGKWERKGIGRGEGRKGRGEGREGEEREEGGMGGRKQTLS